MGWAYRCDACGLPDIADAPGSARCVACGAICAVYECGVTAEAGAPAVVKDKLVKHYDWQIGAWVSSRSERNRLLEQKDLTLVPASEFRQRYGGLEKHGVGYFYPGQRHHRSTGERRRVM